MSEKELIIRDRSNISLDEWRNKEKMAVELLKIVGELRFDRAVELILFRRDIYDARPSKIIDDHLFAKNYIKKPITINSSLELAKAIANIKNLIPSKIDIGTLCSEWINESEDFKDLDEFVHIKLRDFIGVDKNNIKSKDIILYGFGRIGRLAARQIIRVTGSGDQLRLKAIVLRPKLADRYEESKKRAALLQEDTVHGSFTASIEITPDGSEMIINGNRIQIIYAKNPSEIDYTEYGIKDALLIDNTGVWRDKEALTEHMRPGVSQVCLTAPGDGIPNVVFGINQKDYDFEKDNIFCAASCTTNAIVPILKVIDDNIGINSGHIETIHAYTNDQNLLDNFHKKPRRGRGAATNMVLTTTGAAKAVAKVIPHLKGILTGNAVRVPTPNVSLAIISLSVKKEANVKDVNALFKKASLYGNLVEQIHYSDSTEYVSSQAVGMSTTSVLDAPSTIVSSDGKNITIYAWYDNEYGYTRQVVRLAKYAAKVRRKCYY